MQAVSEFFEVLFSLWERFVDLIGIPAALLTTLFTVGLGAVAAVLRHNQKRMAQHRALEAERDALRDKIANMPGQESPDNTLWASLNRFSGPERLDIPGLLVMNLKGGVGKTTISGNLALSLAELGKRVLLVDLDVQGSLSTALMSENTITHREALGIDPKNALGDLLELGYTPDTLKDHAFPVRVSETRADDDRVHLIGSGLSLSDTEDRLLFDGFQQQRDVLRILSNAIRAHNANSDTPFDFVIFDGPPRFGLATANAMKAASHVLVPTRPELISVRAVHQLVRGIVEKEVELGHKLDMAGVVLNEISAQTGIAAERIIAELNEVDFRYGKLGDHVLSTRIPRRAIIGRPETTALVYQNTGATAREVRSVFDALRDELLVRMKVR